MNLRNYPYFLKKMLIENLMSATSFRRVGTGLQFTTVLHHLFSLNNSEVIRNIASICCGFEVFCVYLEELSSSPYIVQNVSGLLADMFNAAVYASHP